MTLDGSVQNTFDGQRGGERRCVLLGKALQQWTQRDSVPAAIGRVVIREAPTLVGSAHIDGFHFTFFHHPP